MAENGVGGGLMGLRVLMLLLVSSLASTEARLLGSSVHEPTLVYHGGPLLTNPSLRLHVLWYGSFSSSHQSPILDFISSFQAQLPPSASSCPSVASWWATTVALYRDSSHSPCTTDFALGTVASDPSYSQGKSLTKLQISTLLQHAIADGSLPQQGSSIYIVFTASDVLVEDFCRSSCGHHSTTGSGDAAYIWVGDAGTQCLGMCAWPFAIPKYGPQPGVVRLPPSGDAATDGMIINLATLLAGTVTNPFGKGYFPNPLDGDDKGQDSDGGDVEAATACPGMFGSGSYPGFPGSLLVDQASGATYNCRGVNNRLFLLPALWSPSTQRCESPI